MGGVMGLAGEGRRAVVEFLDGWSLEQTLARPAMAASA